MDLNILQSVRPTGSFSALCILCELYRCTATRLSLVTSEPLQLSMHSHQGIDTDITQDQRADCDRKVIKGQNLYTPLRKGEQRTQMIDMRVRCTVASISQPMPPDDPSPSVGHLHLLHCCQSATQPTSFPSGWYFGSCCNHKVALWLPNKKCSLLNDTSNNHFQLQLLVNNWISYAWTGLVWFLVLGVGLVEPAGLERGTRKSRKTDFIRSVTGEWKTNKFHLECIWPTLLLFGDKHLSKCKHCTF